MNWHHLPPGTTATISGTKDNKPLIIQVLAWAWDETTQQKNTLWYLSVGGHIWPGFNRAEIGVSRLQYPQGTAQL